MKLSKTSLIFLIVGVFVIALVSLSLFRSQQVQQQNKIQTQIIEAQEKLKGIPLDPLISREGELEKKLSENTAQSETARAAFSQAADNLTISTTLFEIAKTSGVVVKEITSPGTNITKQEGVSLSLLTVSAKVEGEIPNLINYVTRLNSSLKTGSIKSAIITVSDKSGQVTTLADIQLNIYSYKGGQL